MALDGRMASPITQPPRGGGVVARLAILLAFAAHFGCSGSYLAPCDGGRCVDAARPFVDAAVVEVDLALTADLASEDLAPKRTWVVEQSGVTLDLRGVWGSGPMDVYVCGGMARENGVILHSGDGGKSWQKQNAAAPLPLHAIGGSGDGNVIAAGDVGTVVHSIGGGANWVLQNANTVRDLYAVWGTATDVYVAGNYRTILATRDGGKNWRTLREYDPMMPVITLSSLWSPGSPGNVYAAGSRWVLHTVDDGRTWDTQFLPLWDQIVSLWGSSEGDLFIGGASGFGSLAHSADGGKTWVMQKSPLAVDDPVYGIWGTAPGDVYAIGSGSGTILHTIDSGKTWVVQAKAPRPLWHVWGSGAGDVYAVGYTGTIMHLR